MEIMVSVLCTAYNQEKYIEQALRGFVMQNTDFPWEVLINDDASTDGTRNIIDKYVKQYPGLFRTFYHETNQYSQGINVSRTNLLPVARGKYFALCEGDDYWTDPYKLQKQVDYMESHPECTLCIHNSSRVWENGEKAGATIVSSYDRDFSADEVILGGGGFCMTNSIMGPMRLAKNLPGYFDIKTFDYTWQIYLASEGITHCIAEDMSAYRLGSKESVTVKINGMPVASQVKLNRTNEKMMQAFDEATHERFHRAVLSRQGVYKLKNILLSEDNADYDREKCRLGGKFFTKREYMCARMIILSPALYKKAKKIYRKIKGL